MSKLLHLKEWLTLEDAAAYLSTMLEEQVSDADLFQLAIDKHITLSIKLINPVKAKKAEITSIEKASFSVIDTTTRKTIISNIHIHELSKEALNDLKSGGCVLALNDYSLNDSSVVKVSDCLESICGVFDLPLLGAERLDVEHSLSQAIGGPAVTSYVLSGVFLEGDSGTLHQLHEELDDGHQNYIPAQSIESVEGIIYVVRTSNLNNFISQLLPAKDRPIGQREKSSYQKIIGALLDLMLSQTPSGKPRSIFSSQGSIIQALLEIHGNKPGLSERNLQAKFAEGNESLRDF